MAANSQIKMLENRMDFDYSRGVTGCVFVLTRLIISYWSLHAGMTRIVDEPSSTVGYPASAPAASPFQGFFVWVAATPWSLDLANTMIPRGELLIDPGFIVGALVRLAAFLGGVLMVFFHLGNAKWGHDVINDDLSGLMMFAIVGTLATGRILDLDVTTEKMEFAHQRPALKYLLG